MIYAGKVGLFIILENVINSSAIFILKYADSLKVMILIFTKE